ncbi:MAG: hypothetical protein KatS3mg043_1809 [Rhodothermaceae bacterium]|nr:MAG: hypothetical protein KatS3mg043_1809 [Rhodothermaceae bacterium]
MATHTLRQMRLGGLFDHVGFGFHRYATDARWVLPHFEKMLYDQALLVMAYAEAYQATGEAGFAGTVREVLTYVLRDMTAPEGGFYSAEDADSEGREGKFYLWTAGELREVLGPEDAAFVIELFQVEEEGNFAEEATGKRTGENILHLGRPLEETAAAQGIPVETLCARWERLRQRLFAHRARRVHPEKDDKVLTDWNGLMIAALSVAARVLDAPAYAEAARRAAGFLLSTMRTPEGRLLHRWRRGQAGIPALADDYAALVWGLIELYETTFDTTFLEAALVLNRTLLEHFWDEAAGGFFLTPEDGEALPARQKPVYDGALPSANAVAMLNLLRLARLTGDAALERKAAALGEWAGSFVKRMPSAFTGFLLALDFAAGPTYEVVVAGDPGAEDTRALLDVLRRTYLPNKVVLLRPPGDAAITRLAPFTAAQHPVDGRAAAYVCRNFACHRPATEPAELLAHLETTRKGDA